MKRGDKIIYKGKRMVLTDVAEYDTLVVAWDGGRYHVLDTKVGGFSMEEF